ncbi:3-hydroxyacyl-CoA dehydrogenase [Enterococcus sp. LJL90]
MDFKKITVAGSGVLGSQIAFQIAFKGFEVTIYDIDAAAISKGKQAINKLVERYTEELQEAVEQAEIYEDALSYNRNLLPAISQIMKEKVAEQVKQVEKAAQSLHFTDDLQAAVAEADYLIEAVPEQVAIKKDFYQKLAKVAPAKTIFASNSSTFLPSQFAEVSGRPEKFLAMHFSNEIWQKNIAEVMAHEKTDPNVVKEVMHFAEAMGMVPIKIEKEQPEYIMNSLLGPFLDASLNLLVTGIADPVTIDRTWMISTGAPSGPFMTLDVIGLQTAYNIFQNSADAAEEPDNHYQKIADHLKNEYLDKGYYGQANGRGFYSYPNPEFAEEDFLRKN